MRVTSSCLQCWTFSDSVAGGFESLLVSRALLSLLPVPGRQGRKRQQWWLFKNIANKLYRPNFWSQNPRTYPSSLTLAPFCREELVSSLGRPLLLVKFSLGTWLMTPLVSNIDHGRCIILMNLEYISFFLYSSLMLDQTRKVILLCNFVLEMRNSKRKVSVFAKDQAVTKRSSHTPSLQGPFLHSLLLQGS